MICSTRREGTVQTLRWISVVAIFFFTAGLQAQTSEDWKRRNDRGNRYEGLVSISTGNPDLEVLSFTGFFEPFRGNVDLKMKFFMPFSANPFIIAHELDDQRQYWMEVKSAAWRSGTWNEFSPWPTNDVIAKEVIPWDNIGVLIKLNAGNQLAPAFVYHRYLPDRVQQYSFYLRSNRNLKNVRLTLEGTNTASKRTTQTLNLGKQAASVPFSAHLNLNGFKEGMVRVIITRELRDSPQSLPVREYVFYHKPQLP